MLLFFLLWSVVLVVFLLDPNWTLGAFLLSPLVALLLWRVTALVQRFKR